MQLLADLLELAIGFCARLGGTVLRPLGAPRVFGALYPLVAWLLGLCIFLAFLTALVLWVFA
jgi:hypothetical protein